MQPGAELHVWPATRAEYERAYQALGERSEYRRLVEIKLNALGVDPRPATTPAGAQGAASEAGK